MNTLKKWSIFLIHLLRNQIQCKEDRKQKCFKTTERAWFCIESVHLVSINKMTYQVLLHLNWIKQIIINKKALATLNRVEWMEIAKCRSKFPSLTGYQIGKCFRTWIRYETDEATIKWLDFVHEESIQSLSKNGCLNFRFYNITVHSCKIFCRHTRKRYK